MYIITITLFNIYLYILQLFGLSINLIYTIFINTKKLYNHNYILQKYLYNKIKLNSSINKN